MSDEVKWKREYHSNGQLAYEVPFVNGQKHGVVKWWYSNGQLKKEIPMVDGQAHGTLKIWNTEGQLENIFFYINYKKVSEEEYREYELICQLSGIKDE